MSVAAFLVYAALDLLLRPRAGSSVAALGLFPVLLTGYIGGFRAGTFAGAVFAPLVFTLGLAAGEPAGPFFGENVTGMLAVGATGPAAGWIGESQRRLRGRAGELDAERSFAQHLIEDANALIVGVDADGRVRTFNRHAERVFGRPRAEILGTFWWETVLPRERYPQLAQDGQPGALDVNEIPRVFEMPLQQADGQVQLVSWRISPVEKDGRFDGIIAYGTEVTPARTADLAAIAPVARAVVQELVAALARSGAVGQSAERGLGRSIAAALPAGDLEAHVAAYHAMGLGHLRIRAKTRERLDVSGEDLIEQRLRSTQPTCYIALGFLEGVAAAACGGDCLGAEVRCASQGAPHCEFVVRARGSAAHAREPPAANVPLAAAWADPS